jgi:hypothetical protein
MAQDTLPTALKASVIALAEFCHADDLEYVKERMDSVDEELRRKNIELSTIAQAASLSSV